MLSWGPWLLFAVGILLILAAPMLDHQVIQDAVRGRREVPLVAGEVLVVCGSLLMIAGAALPRFGRSSGERLWSSEAERTLEGDRSLGPGRSAAAWVGGSRIRA